MSSEHTKHGLCIQLLYVVERSAMPWEELDLLEEIGLTGYERKALATLIAQGVADAETLRQLAKHSERQIRAGTGLRRDTIRLIRHGTGVKRSTYQRVIEFLRSSEAGAGTGTRVHGARE